jgi:hypothetical protein
MTDTAVRTETSRPAARKERGRLALAVVGLGGLLLLAAAAWLPGGFALDVGQPGDALFLRGFHGDERADGRTYRWSRGAAQVIVPGLGGAERLRVTLAAEGGRTPPQPVPATVLVDGQPAAAIQVGPAAVQVVEATRGDAGADAAVVEIQAPTFRPTGDARDLGIIVDRVWIEPVGGGWSARAWAGRWLPLVALTALGAMALWPLRRRAPAGLWLGLPALAVTIGAVVARPWLLAGWGWLMLAAAGVAAVVHRRPIAAAALAGARALDRPRAALAALAALIVVYGAIMTALAARIEWIGHADYADNAVVARNLVNGRGYTVDYVAQFYRDYPPTISHPADVWPILQPTLIAGSFLLFGVNTFAAKLPNIAIMCGLLAATAWVGRRLFGWAAGLAAAGLLALDGFFFEGTLFPLNDLAFALGALLLVGLAARLSEVEAAGGRRLAPWYVGLGMCAGLLFASKPSGALLALGVAGWWLWQRRPGGPLRWPGWRWVAIGVGATLLVAAPVVGRNLATFGAPFFSTEMYDAWVAKWEPPDENIYRLMANDLPHPRRLVGFGFDRVTEAVALQFRKLGNDLAGGALIEPALLILAGVGLAIGGAAVRRTIGALAWGVAPYALFVLVYWHYEERYFVFLLPWIGILACGAVATLLAWVFERGNAGQQRVAVGLVALGVALIVLPRAQFMVNQATSRLLPTAGDVVIGEWLAEHTPPEAVVMTRVPWQIAWHSGRRAVMIPLAPIDGIAATIQRYGVDYLLVGNPNQTAIRREALAPLYEGRETLGFTRVQEFRNERGERYATLYAVPAAMRGGP